MDLPKKSKTKSGIIHLPIIIALLAILLIPVIIFGAKFSSRKIDVAAANSINITAAAVQKIYQNGVPHTDKNGNFRNTYDPNSSFFPNGMYLISDEQKDIGAVAALANAGFNLGITAQGSNTEYSLNQINGTNNYTVVISTIGSNLNIVAVAETEQSNIEIESPDLVAGNSYIYFVCVLNCEEGTLVKTGNITAEAGTNGQGKISLSWESGANLKMIVSNFLGFDSNHNYDATTFNDSLFQSYKNNPSVFGWWIADEPYNIAKITGQNPQISYDNINQVYNNIKDQTNQVIFITESATPPFDATWKQIVSLGDLANIYYYPRYFNLPLNSFKNTADSVKSMVNAVNSNKPAWFTSQTFLGGGGFVYPTPTEMKAYIYTTLIHGATGLTHFAWDSCVSRTISTDDLIKVAGIRPNIKANYGDCLQDAKTLKNDELAAAKALWNALDAQANGVNKEINELTPVILSPTLKTPYNVFVDQTPISTAPIRTMLKAYNGNYYLLAVNIDKATINASFQFLFTLQGPIERMFEDSTATFAGISINDSFSPFAVHVYKFPTGNDADLDSFTDTVENAIGTDSNSACATQSGTDAWPPDFNRDGVVNIVDLSRLIQKYGKTKTAADWQTIKRYDVDANGAINIRDIAIVTKSFGSSFC